VKTFNRWSSMACQKSCYGVKGQVVAGYFQNREILDDQNTSAAKSRLIKGDILEEVNAAGRILNK